MQPHWWHRLNQSRACILLLVGSWLPNASAALIENGNFESPSLTQNWFVFGGNGSLSLNTTEKHTGNASALIEKRAQSFVGPGQDLKGKLQEGVGVTYTLSAWVKPKNPPQKLERFKLGIKLEDTKGSQFIEIDVAPLQAHLWTKLSGPFTLKPNGSLKSLTLYVFNEDAKTDFYVDDVEITSPVAYTPTPAGAKDFIRAKGRDLVVGANDKVVRLMGTNFIAYDDDDSQPADKIFRSKNYDEIDYKRVSEMGMNVVRLAMTYKVFEENTAPGVYKQEGWDWLEKNIVWARKYGVYLILDMHVPPGGYQSWGYSGPFWGTNAQYRTRLNNLWKAIAQRYKNEPFIAGYDLINEPAPNNNQQWITYAQELTDVIRSVDKNHLLIVEEAFTDGSEHFILKDQNILYDFHLYESWEFSNQFIYTKGRGYGGRYPDPEVSVFPWDMKDADLVLNTAMPTGNSDWTYYEGKLHKITDANVFGATPAFVSKDNSGKVYFDDFVVKEYDPNGQLVNTLVHAQVDKKPSDWYFLNSIDPLLSYAEEWTAKKVGTGNGTKAIEKTGRIGTGAISISKATGTYTVQNVKMTLPVKVGYSYQISGWIKGENVKGSAMLGLHFKQFQAGDKRQPFTKEYLENVLLANGMDYYIKNNVPVNIGEFGIGIYSFQNDLGGERLVADFLDLFQKYHINAQYFNYHGIDYGIYTNLLGFPFTEAANSALVNTFSTKLGGTLRLPEGGSSGSTNTPVNQNVPTGTEIPDSTLTPNTQPETPQEIPRPKPISGEQAPFSEACVAAYTPDVDNSRLDIPCVEVSGQIYSLTMNQRFSPFIFLTDVENIQTVQNIAADNNCLAHYLTSDNSLYTPCVRDTSTAIIWEAYFYQVLPTVLFVLDMTRVQQR